MSDRPPPHADDKRERMEAGRRDIEALKERLGRLKGAVARRPTLDKWMRLLEAERALLDEVWPPVNYRSNVSRL